MSLRRVVAAPFRQRGRDRLAESEFVVALSLDRDWFSPDQATRVVERALGEGLLTRDGEDGELRVAFDPATVSVPPGFSPDEDLLREASAFERALEALTDAGVEKRDAVGAINRLQADLGLTADAAAVLYARRQGLAVEDAARAAIADLESGATPDDEREAGGTR